MKLASNLFIAALVCTFVACKQESKEKAVDTAITNTAPAAPATGTTPAQGSTAALNPAHGQPGHRCDIEVGAPLSSPAQPNLVAPKPVLGTPATGGGAVAPGTNPPHGQPGHDCAVPVGAPLPKK